MLENWHDSATSDPDTLFFVRQAQHLRESSALFSNSIVPIVPVRGHRQGALDSPDVIVIRNDEFGANQDILSKHELRIQVSHVVVLWELKPHSSHKRVCFRRTLVEHSVDVVDQVVSHHNCILDDSLNSFILRPGLSILIVDLIVRSKERIEHAKLIHHHPKILGRDKLIAWNISATKWMSSHAERKHFIERAIRFAKESLSIASPHRAVLLAAKEVRAGENEGTKSFMLIFSSPALV